MKRKFMICFLIITIFAVFQSCEKSTEPQSDTTDPASSKTKSDQAYQMLEGEFDKVVNGSFHSSTDYDQLKFEGANNLYKDAVKLNPGNVEAQFGLAITEILSAYSDNEINKMVKDFESSTSSSSFSKVISNGIIPVSTDKMAIPLIPVAENVFTIHKMATQNPPLISSVQKVIKEKFLPRVDNAISALNAIENSSDAKNFRFVVSGKMMGNTKLSPVSIYITEIYLTDAAMSAIKALLQSFLVYKFELPDYSAASVAQALQPDNQNFFVLASDGKQRSSDVKTCFVATLNKLKSGIDALKNISGLKSDAVLKLGSGGVRQQDLDTVITYTDKILTAFNQGLGITLKNADTEGNNYSITVNLSNYFDNPPDNPKKKFLPEYTVSAQNDDVIFNFKAETYNEFVFPDPTFSGLFPGMSNETLKRILFIDKEYAFWLTGGAWSGWGDFYNDAEIQLVCSSGKSYNTKTNNLGKFKFVIGDAPKIPLTVNNVYISIKGIQIEMGKTDAFFPDMQIGARMHVSYDLVVPKIPEKLSAEKSSQGVQITWKVDSHDNGNGEFIIQRKTDNGNFQDLFLLSGTSINYSYSDKFVSAGHNYTYRIKASNWVLSSYHILYPKEDIFSNTVSIAM